MAMCRSPLWFRLNRARAAQPIPFRALILYCGGKLMFVSHDHDVSAFICVGEENCCSGIRCLPRFVCQREEWVRGVEFRTRHVGGEDDWLLSLGDEPPDVPVDCGFLRILPNDPHGLRSEGEPQTAWFEDGAALP